MNLLLFAELEDAGIFFDLLLPSSSTKSRAPFTGWRQSERQLYCLRTFESTYLSRCLRLTCCSPKSSPLQRPRPHAYTDRSRENIGACIPQKVCVSYITAHILKSAPHRGNFSEMWHRSRVTSKIYNSDALQLKCSLPLERRPRA